MNKILLSCGANGNGQLGIGRSDVALVPEYVQVALPSSEDLIHTTCGSYHSLAVMRSGKVFAWGMNKNGQLGFSPDTVVTISTPTRLRIPAPTGTSQHLVTRDGDMRILLAAAGESHTALLSAGGEVLTFGSNAVGQLGRLTEDTFSFAPTAVDFSSTTVAAIHNHLSACSIFAGPNTTFAITPAGHLFGWGGSSSNELGFQQGIVPLPKSIALPSSLHHSYKVVKVAAGVAHTLLLTSTGEVFVSGDNTDGQLGVQGSNISTWRAVRHARNLRDVATSAQQSFFLTAVGILSECGSSEFGPQHSSKPPSVAVMEGISTLQHSTQGSAPPRVPVTLPSATPSASHGPDLIYAMQDHECNGVASCGSSVVAWSEKGDIFVRGRNHRGQLGLGHISSVSGSFVKLELSKKMQTTLNALSNGGGGSNGKALKLGKLHKVCMGRAHALAVYSVQGGEERACSPPPRSATPRHHGSFTGHVSSTPGGDSSEVLAMGEIFASADDLEEPHHDSSDFGESSLSNESFRRSCVDDLMNLSFSRHKAPALSFAAANKSTTTNASMCATVLGQSSRSTPSKTPTKKVGDAGVAGKGLGGSSVAKATIFSLVMTAVAVGVVVATGKQRHN